MSTPLGGNGPRTSNLSPANTRSPQNLSATQCFAIHAVSLRGSTSAGRKPTAITAVTSENQTMKIVERRMSCVKNRPGPEVQALPGVVLWSTAVITKLATYFKYSLCSRCSVPGCHHAAMSTPAGSTG